jgi:small-conductance mechanosensitive channel
MKKSNTAIKETSFVAIGELIVSLIIVAVYMLIGQFSYKVVTGVVLGSLFITLNYLFLSISVNRAIDAAMENRGEGELDEEATENFVKENSAKIQNAVKLSFIIRTVSMLAALIIAFVSGQFDVLATLIPLLMLRPIIMATEYFRKKVN